MSQIVQYLQGLHLCGGEIANKRLVEGILDEWYTKSTLETAVKKRKGWKGCLKIPCFVTKK